MIRNGLSNSLLMDYSIARALFPLLMTLYVIHLFDAKPHNLKLFFWYYRYHSEQHNFLLDLKCVSKAEKIVIFNF